MAFTEQEERILKLIAAGFLNALGGGASGSGGVLPSGTVASDADLDGPKGDPKARFDPKKYLEEGGESCKGCPLSICSPAFLDAYAEALQYFAEHPKPGKEQYAKFDSMDAARARGWAKRLRSKSSGGTSSNERGDASDAPFSDDNDIPF